MGTSYNPPIVKNGLVLNIDPANIKSYPAANDYRNNASLLLNFNGINGSTSFIDSGINNLTITAFGNAQISTSQSKFGGSSAYFDGNGDYLSTSSSSAMSFGTGDFTVEGWFYALAIGSNTCLVDICNSASVGIMIRQNTNNSLLVYSRTTSTILITTANNSLSTNTWQHIAVVRYNGTLTVYINGVSAGTASSTTSFASTSLTIGGFYDGTSASPYGYNGYIDNLRITREARYTSAFTPPDLLTAQDSNSNNVSLMLDGESLNDSSQNGFTITNSGVTVNSSQVKYGNSSLYFNGSSFLSVPNSSAFGFGTGDFTIETWLKLGAAITATSGDASYRAIVNKYSAGSDGTEDAFMFLVNNAGGTMQVALIFISNVTSSAFTFNITGADNSLNGVWNHIAAVRSAGSLKVYFNGTQIGTTQTYTSNINQGTLPLLIGARTYAPYDLYLNGYIDDLRITKAARYTANFTPPTGPLPLPGRIYDLTTNKRTATLTNSPIFNSSNGGSLSYVRSSNQYTSVGALSGSFSSFTVEVWFYPTSISNYENILDGNYAYNGTTGNIGPRLEMTSTGYLGWLYSNITNNNDSYYNHPVKSSGLGANTWHCVSITYNGTSNSSITYYNGLNTGLSRVTNGSPTGFIGTMNNLRIAQGFSLLSYTQRGFDGRISIVRLYNRDLTASEILQNYNATKGRFGL